MRLQLAQTRVGGRDTFHTNKNLRGNIPDLSEGLLVPSRSGLVAVRLQKTAHFSTYVVQIFISLVRALSRSKVDTCVPLTQPVNLRLFSQPI